VHNLVFPALRPHEVNFFHLLLVVQKPPEASFEKRSNKHAVVAFADKHLEMHLLLVNRHLK
jgi:hypothetical protein